MRLVSGSVVCVGLFCLWISTPAFAEPIVITSGSMLVTGPFELGSISVSGTHGFSLDASVTPGEGYIAPLHTECSPRCDPGATISVAGFQGGPSFVGTATLGGDRFTLTGSIDDPAGVFFEFRGTATLPGAANAATVVTAPFTAHGGVSDVISGNASLIRAAGFVSLWLSPVPAQWELPEGWVVDQVRYAFSDTPAPIPEPATMVLLGTGLAVAALRSRRRRGSR